MLNLSNLFKLLEDRGTSANLSKKTGISTGNISDWKSGRSKPSAETLVKIANVLGCSTDYILGRTNNPKIVDDITPIYRFPTYYEQEAAAGVGFLNPDTNFNMDEYVIDNIPDNASYAIKISGESMYSKITDYKLKTGSIVLVNPKFLNSELEDKIVIVNFQGKTICKRCINKGSYLLFQSDNEEFEKDNRKSSDDPNCRILGIVLGVIEDDKFISIR